MFDLQNGTSEHQFRYRFPPISIEIFSLASGARHHFLLDDLRFLQQLWLSTHSENLIFRSIQHQNHPLTSQSLRWQCLNQRRPRRKVSATAPTTLTQNRSPSEQIANYFLYTQSSGLSALRPPTLSATTFSSPSLPPMSPTNHSKST